MKQSPQQNTTVEPRKAENNNSTANLSSRYRKPKVLPNKYRLDSKCTGNCKRILKDNYAFFNTYFYFRTQV